MMNSCPLLWAQGTDGQNSISTELFIHLTDIFETPASFALLNF
jgi:hypothetical protein